MGTGVAPASPRMMPELQLDRTVHVPHSVMGLPGCSNKQLRRVNGQKIDRSPGASSLLFLAQRLITAALWTYESYTKLWIWMVGAGTARTATVTARTVMMTDVSRSSPVQQHGWLSRSTVGRLITMDCVYIELVCCCTADTTN
jgi:hypothetical protein